MKWVKQDGAGAPFRYVCSHCGTLLVRMNDDHPLPERCQACGAASEDNPSTACGGPTSLTSPQANVKHNGRLGRSGTPAPTDTPKEDDAFLNAFRASL